ncbi:MraW methylase [Helicosporidium sp. ATCC 50920]|nr:MraW methylase [Helicosporidium sp. ATCC 50920]|eukprot:KDD75027.1 MraW methylase [Helicosporidium sp. ATCC 50920]
MRVPVNRENGWLGLGPAVFFLVLLHIAALLFWVPSILRRAFRVARPRLPPPRVLRSALIHGDPAHTPPPHASVLLEETVRAFEGLRVRTLLDCTLGAGGHSAALAAAHPELERIVGIDLDPTALELAGARLQGLGFRLVRVPGLGEAGGAEERVGEDASLDAGPSCGTCHLSEGPYSELSSVLRACGVSSGSVDAVLLDAGMSSMQVDSPSRGFSFRHPTAPLDMRMGPRTGSLNAAQFLARSSQARLEEVFRLYGQIPHARALAERVAWTRATAPIETVGDFLRVVGGRRERGRSHPATRAFQALRIAVNDELRRLEEALWAALRALRPGGRLAIISFHSLEDGVVKRAFRAAAGALGGGMGRSAGRCAAGNG